MNIHHMLQAVEHLKAAKIATMDTKQRAELQEMIEKLCAMLRSNGVFIGTGE